MAGNWCGPFYSAGKWQSSVCDDSVPSLFPEDECCKVHDCCFYNCHGGSSCNHKCNQDFVQCQARVGTLFGKAMSYAVPGTSYGTRRMRGYSDPEDYAGPSRVEYTSKVFPWDDQDTRPIKKQKVERTPWVRRVKAKTGISPNYIGKQRSMSKGKRRLFTDAPTLPARVRSRQDAISYIWYNVANRRQRLRAARIRRSRFLTHRSRVRHFRNSRAARRIQRAFLRRYYEEPDYTRDNIPWGSRRHYLLKRRSLLVRARSNRYYADNLRRNKLSRGKKWWLSAYRK